MLGHVKTTIWKSFGLLLRHCRSHFLRYTFNFIPITKRDNSGSLLSELLSEHSSLKYLITTKVQANEKNHYWRVSISYKPGHRVRVNSIVQSCTLAHFLQPINSQGKFPEGLI